MPERAYLSIGEVLVLLRDEFTDITISKIRFLESQGLIDPERTPSGYRKFYEPDVERLRWILRQQKEHYLPLRVIKGKLSEAPTVDDPTEEDETEEHDEIQARPPPLTAVGDDPPGRRAVPPFPESLRHSTRSAPAAFLTGPDPGRHLRSSPDQGPTVTPIRVARGNESDEGTEDDVELTLDELSSASGLPVLAVAELERYGLIKGRSGPGGHYFDTDALEVASLAVEFARFGVEARHLRMWKNVADREADFYEQVVMPLRSQRGGKARRQAEDTVSELAGLGARLHATLVAGAMKRPI